VALRGKRERGNASSHTVRGGTKQFEGNFPVTKKKKTPKKKKQKAEFADWVFGGRYLIGEAKGFCGFVKRYYHGHAVPHQGRAHSGQTSKTCF